MSVFKTEKSPFFYYSFQIRCHKFYGPTGKTERREAEAVEKLIKQEAHKEIEHEKNLGGKAPPTFDYIAGRYMLEVGNYHKRSNTTLMNLKRLIEFFGKEKRLDEITGSEVAALIARRRAETYCGRKTISDPENPKQKIPAPKISAATVNRSTIEPLQKLFNRAKSPWGYTFPNEPHWRKLMLKEPQERIREVRATEESALEESVRADYRLLVEFARASGLRQAECLLKKDQVHLREGEIETVGKGDRIVRRPITGEMRAILIAAMQNTTDWVFTYKAKRANKKLGITRGQDLPITQSGLQTTWRRARTGTYSANGAKLPADLRFHDMRHDFATTLLRSCKNLKIVQKALGHTRIETTSRYANVTDDDIRAAMEGAAKVRQEKRARKVKKKSA